MAKGMGGFMVKGADSSAKPKMMGKGSKGDKKKSSGKRAKK